jgi:ubiquitin related modifier 1
VFLVLSQLLFPTKMATSSSSTESPAASSPATTTQSLRFSIELLGGLDALFGGKKRFEVSLPVSADLPTPTTLRTVLAHVRTSLLKERPELFMAGETVRPGILVLVNDADWELEGGLDYVVEEGDVIAFISTLHGG